MPPVEKEGATRFLEQVVLLDIEVRVDRTGPIEIGAVLGEATVRRRVEGGALERVLKEVARKSAPRALLGHNVLLHDIPILLEYAPDASLLKLPIIDTLSLSPLAFPEHPYHALVKGYKLTKCAVNNPVEDARQAGRVFVDEWESLCAREREQPGTLGLYCFLFARATADGALADRRGIADAFLAMGGTRMDFNSASVVFARIAEGRACSRAVAAILRELLGGQIATDNEVRRERGELALALAYAAAWLPVAGDRSVIPQWVWREMPTVARLVGRLREEPCGEEDCDYCRAVHDPIVQLKRYFGFESFRKSPSGPDGGSLQQDIVRHGMRRGSHLAILPTGGGKSLCFQLPALVRNFCRGSLTVVLSPLQALMRDQVENLNKKTRTRSAALYGMLTPMERSQVLHEISAGDITVLYIAPEQLRNRSFRRAVKQREIGGWVFDEAHCLSKWGHDFRPDYLYACRAIQEIADEQHVTVPPIAALTATAKLDVIKEICAHFEDHLGVRLSVFAGGVQRDNLTYAVEMVQGGEKGSRVRELCAESVESSTGSVIVYHATRRATETMAGLLQRAGLPAAHFHGGMNAADKKEAMSQFLNGRVRVICATNAFGMGVDKPDVRLVVHSEIPGTLENYLQEAGRAGRDQDRAHCVLLFDEDDVESQFRMIKDGEISHRDIVQMLRGLRYCGRRGNRGDGEEFQLTSGELLRDEEVDTSFDAEERSADTKVRTAVSWLERAGYVERNLNHTIVFSGKPVLNSLSEVEARMDELEVHGLRRAMWTQMYLEMLRVDPDEGLSVDDFAGLPAFLSWRKCLPPKEREASRVSHQILDQLRAMTKAGLLKAGMVLTAFVHSGGPRPSLRVLDAVNAIEREILDVLPGQAPDVESGTWARLSLRLLNEELRRRGVESNVEVVRSVLMSLSKDDGRIGGDVHLTLRSWNRDHLNVRLQGTFQQLRERAELRRSVAHTCLRALLDKVGLDTEKRANQLIEFSLDDLVQAVSGDLMVRGRLGAVVLDPIERVLLFLHYHGCIILQNGLAVFRAAMTLKLMPEAKGRRYTKEHYELLRAHYEERTVQVHVMHRYAQLGLEPNGAAADFVAAYFDAPRDEFLTRYFEKNRKDLSRAIGPQAYRRIVDSLEHAVQQRIVTAPADENQLVLAGPGSGKTKVVVHRCAYLLRVLRVRRSAVLVLCFNRSTVLELRRRLKELLGGRLGGLQIHTYDSLALRIAGRSLIGVEQPECAHDSKDIFQVIREEACELIEGGRSSVGLEADELRDRLLSGYQHILVDEYQDIDATQYRFVSAIAGRTLADKDARLSIMAVGDDDQNIYSWRGSSVAFIQRFAEEYQAKSYELVDNYRSTANIIAVSNRWIAINPDRTKTQAIRVDHKREHDPEARGEPVHLLRVAGPAQQIAEVAQKLSALSHGREGRDWNEVAVLAREWKQLMPLRVRCRELGIPVRWAGEESVKPWQVRETRRLLDALSVGAMVDPPALRQMVQDIQAECGSSVWTSYLAHLLELWIDDSGTAGMPDRTVSEFLWSVMREERQLAMVERGVFLGTVHQAKGMEFDHVVLLDGGWGPQRGEGIEDLRRLFYVGMTRARRELTVLAFADRPRSFASSVLGPEVVVHDATAAVAEQSLAAPRRMAHLGLGELYIDYAGRKPENHRIHSALSKLRVGSILELRLEDERGRARLVDPESGHAVAALSRVAQEIWVDRMILEIRVLAIVRRTRYQSTLEHRDKCLVEEWEIPVVEVVWR